MEKGAIDSPTPLWKIIIVAQVAAGVQFGWSLQLSLLTPYVQTLGVPHIWASFIWLCGPMSGLLVQPIVGYKSDRCTSSFGRRRPFIAAGGVAVALAVFLIGFAKDLGHHWGDSLDGSTKPRAVAIFVVGFWVLDVANNMLQGPCRAFLADLSNGNHNRIRISNEFFSFFMAVGNVLGYAAGSYPGLYKFFPFTTTQACDTTCANLKSCFIIDIVLLLFVTITAISVVKEKPFRLEDLKEDSESSTSLIGQMKLAFRSFKKPMWLLLLVTCLNWIAWFPFLLFDTDWVGTEVYGGKVDGNANEKRIYDLGVHAGSLGLMINSIVLAFSSLAIMPLGRMVGGVKRLWGLVNIILAIALASTVWITMNAESWRASQAPDLFPPPASIKASTMSVFGVLGIPLSVTFSIPFALASIYCSTAGGGQGLSLGVLNLAIVLPQLFVSVISGPLDAAFGGGNLPAFVMGAIAAAVSGLLAMFMLPNPPKQVALQPVIVGGH